MGRSAFFVLFWVAAVVSLIGQFAVLRDVIAGRAPANSGTPGARWREIAWVLIPAAGLIAVLVATWFAVVAAGHVALTSASVVV
jgi:heme/copper-type cytochrome/quinol oxidase subunit 2